MSIFANKTSRINATVLTAIKIPVCAQKAASTPISASSPARFSAVNKISRRLTVFATFCRETAARKSPPAKLFRPPAKLNSAPDKKFLSRAKLSARRTARRLPVPKARTPALSRRAPPLASRRKCKIPNIPAPNFR